MNAIEFKNVHKSFSNGRYHVFKGMSFSIPKGKVAFILGPSGVGKSVTLKHILGLLTPDEGDVLVYGKPIPYKKPSELSDLRKNFGMLFQHAALFDDFTVFQNVAFPLIESQMVEKEKKLDEDGIRKKVMEKLKAVGLDPENTMDKYPNELSGGMKKRVGLARAIVLEPEILLYDEPTTGLDPMTRSMVDDLIIETNRAFGLTSLVISHDIPAALASADEIGFIYEGKMAFWGSPAEFRQCSHPIVHKFLEAEKRHRREVV